MLASKYGDTDFITGMRAYAASMVILIHLGGAGLRDLGALGNKYADFGRVGVYVFFAISGFAVASNWSRAQSLLTFICQRFLRLAPLYYFWIIVACFVPMSSNSYWRNYFNVEIDPYNLVMHFLFLSSWDRNIANSVIGVEWSVSIEMFWYFLVPALCMIIGRKSGLVALIISVCSYYALRSYGSHIFQGRDWGLSLHWNPLTYATPFCLGVWAFKLRSVKSISKGTQAKLFLLGIVLFLGIPIYQGIFERFGVHEFIIVSIATFIILISGSSENKLCRLLFENRCSQHAGVISYGLYLSHLFMLGIAQALPDQIANPLLLFLIVLASSILVSTVLYKLIELPAISLGRQFAENRAIIPASASSEL